MERENESKDAREDADDGEDRPLVEPRRYTVVKVDRDTKPNLSYDYDLLTSDPVPGIEPGTILPREDFPEDLVCPFCDDKPSFKTAQGLRGHAHGKHGLRWELPPQNKTASPDLPDWSKMTPPEERETLRPYHAIAIAMHELYGMAWTAVGEKIGKSPGGLSAVAKSPAGLRFQAEIHKLFNEPEKLAQLLLKANSVNATADYLIAMEMARDANDYAVLGKFAKDLMQMTGGIAENKKAGSDGSRPELHVHLSGDLFTERAIPNTSFEVIEADIEDDE